MWLKNHPEGKLQMNGRTFYTVNVISKFLQFLKKQIENDLQMSYHKSLDDDGYVIKWFLTVPAMWDDTQKAIMRKAAFKAGWIEEESSENLSLILEPDAAAAFCLMEQKKQGQTIPDGSNILIVDCGGGTIDLTSCKINKGRLEEIVPSSGNDSGSTQLDKAFWQLLCNKFGKEKMEALKEQYHSAYYKLMNEWESIKCEVKDLQTIPHLQIPIRIFKKLQIKVPSYLLQNPEEENLIKFQEDDWKSVFVPTLHSILSITEHLVETSKTIDYIFLVGGFGKSKLLQQLMITKFEQSNRVKKVICSPQAGEAIVKGAAIIGYDNTLIASRKMKRCYGVELVKDSPTQISQVHESTTVAAPGDEVLFYASCSIKYDEKPDEEQEYIYVIESDEDEIYEPLDESEPLEDKYSDYHFAKFVSIGDSVNINEPIICEYEPEFQEQNNLELEFFVSESNDPTHTKDERVIKIGKIVIDFEGVPLGSKEVEVKYYVGGTEIRVEAMERSTKRMYKAKILYDRNHFVNE